MAGRGTDIKLGDGVKEAGGLHILGTERHEARRIDNQLRGRSGRQGDPGSSRFYLCLDDPLLRLFGSDRMGAWLARMGLKEGQEIEHKWITRTIEKAQKKNRDEKTSKLESIYLNMMMFLNRQRQTIYDIRNKILKK